MTADRQPPPPVTEHEMDELQRLLDAVPPTREPLDVSMLDGFLCAALLQPEQVPTHRLLPFVTDIEGRSLPPGHDLARLHLLVMKRHAELDAAIAARQWFDPWVFELDDDADDGDASTDDGEDGPPASVDAAYAWAAGFATALDLFPALMRQDGADLTEPLALVYRHLEPDDLEDADALLAEIDTLEPVQDLGEAVEGLVRATLLLADISRPLTTRPVGMAPARARRPR